MKLQIISLCLALALSYGGNLQDNLQIKENTETYQVEKTDGYKLFYGTWEYKKIVSQHRGLGGDVGCGDLIGKTITYTPEYFENETGRFNNPDYRTFVYPVLEDGENQFFEKQTAIDELLPDTDFFVYVDIANRLVGQDMKWYGYEIIVKDDKTLYAYDYNCIYELERISYGEDYQEEDISYQEY